LTYADSKSIPQTVQSLERIQEDYRVFAEERIAFEGYEFLVRSVFNGPHPVIDNSTNSETFHDGRRQSGRPKVQQKL
jgi:hypothetical protein